MVQKLRLAELTLHAPRQWGGMLVGADAVGASGAGPVLGTALAGELAKGPDGWIL